ncbi:hypothetical protein [Oceanithermus sp.]
MAGKVWGLAVLIEGLSRYLVPRQRPRIGSYRRYDDIVTRLDLNATYYLARGSRGPELIPYDEFLEEVENMLWSCTNHRGHSG